MAVGTKVTTAATEQISIMIQQPSDLYHSLHTSTPKRLHTGVDLIAHKFVGQYKRRSVIFKKLLSHAETVDSIVEREVKLLTDTELQQKVAQHAAYFRRKAYSDLKVNKELLSALATLVEVCRRTLGLRPHIEQIVGALGLYLGHLVEMATGEGKSLTASIAATLTGWKNRPCHILTVNSYLAERDALEFSEYYAEVGLSVGYVTDGMSQDERRNHYKSHIVYTTSKELLADFLRDRLAFNQKHTADQIMIRNLVNRQSTDRLVLRGIDTVIVDEADSILIDEAISPLIISSPVENQAFIDSVKVAKGLSSPLQLSIDYEVDAEYRSITLTTAGKEKLKELAAPLHGFWHGKDRREELVTQSLIAKEFFIRDKNYIVQDGKVIIIDEFTGRLTPGRSWSNGLHQSVEAKEEIEITYPNETVARMSFQKFFRYFKSLSGMTGTAKESSSEFWNIYELPSLLIPPHKPINRKSLPIIFRKTEKEKWLAIIQSVQGLYGMSRSVLIGVRTIQESNTLSALLDGASIPHQLLNAVKHEDEADIIREAGINGRVTIATNMAGRGTDIKLDEYSKNLGGLHIILSGLNDSGRIDRQLMGRCARQGDPGSVQVFLSSDDEILKGGLPPAAYKSINKVFEYSGHSNYLQYLPFRIAQRRLEKKAQKQRKSVLKADNWLEESLTFGSGYS